MSPQEMMADIRDTLSPLPQGPRLREAVDNLARKYIVSASTIYRWANKAGLRWRKERADKGNGKVGREEALKIGALLQASRRLTKSIPLPACDAVEILQDSGLLTKDVSTSTCLRALRQHKISGQDILRPAPYRDLYAEHPNEVHGFDVTNCLQWDFDEKKGMTGRDVEMTLYPNKLVKTAKKIRREILRYMLVDKASGWFYFRYYYAAGEKATDGMDFLYRAWRPKEDERYRGHGVPEMLYADRGAIVHANACKNMLAALGVRLETHMPGNPRAKGLVEGMMHFANRFEAMLKTRRPRGLDELNDWALDWCIYINAEKEFRETDATRSGLFNYITQEQLRLCPDWETLSFCIRTAPETRRVNGNLIFQYRGRNYRIPDSNNAGRTVSVCFNPYDFPQVVATDEDGTTYFLAPVETDVFGQRRDDQAVHFGEFKGHKHTETQQAKKEMETIAEEWGISYTGNADKRRSEPPKMGVESPIKFFGHQAEKVGNVAFMDKPGIEIELDAKPEPRRMPRIQALQKVVELIGRNLTKAEYEDIAARYGESVSDEDVAAEAERLKGKEIPEGIHAEKKVAHWRSG